MSKVLLCSLRTMKLHLKGLELLKLLKLLDPLPLLKLLNDDLLLLHLELLLLLLLLELQNRVLDVCLLQLLLLC